MKHEMNQQQKQEIKTRAAHVSSEVSKWKILVDGNQN
jgi:hypothetical protein